MVFICIEKIMSNNSRTLINVIGLPLILFLIYIGDIFFNFVIYLAIIISTKEFNDICNKKNISPNLIWLYLLYCIIFISTYFEYNLFNQNIELFIPSLLLLFIFEIFRKKENPFQNISCSIFGLIWIGLFLNSIVLIRDIPIYGFLLALVMFLSVWICDTFAFVVGSKFGRKKILENISPNKTWLGSIAGFCSVLIFNYLLFLFNVFELSEYHFTIYDIIIFSIIFGVVSQLGDLFESMIKRSVKIKDSGTILMGHGGFLDRMDSLMFVAPLYYLYLKFFIDLNG